MAGMFSLSHRQLETVMAAAKGPQEKRALYLQILELRGRFNDSDVADVASLAAFGLSHKQTDAA
jgi:hypothetical protein